MKKQLTKLAAITLSMAMMFAMGVRAPKNVKAAVTDGKIAMTKHLNIGTGTKTKSDITFGYKAEAVSHNGDTTATANMPTVTLPSITYTAQDWTDTSARDKKSEIDFNDTKVATWKESGVYVYKVTETYTTPQSGDPKTQAGQTTYSQAQYEVKIVVADKGTAGAPNYEATSVFVTVTNGDDGQAVTNQKVEAGPAADFNTNGFKFVSEYVNTPAGAGTGDQGGALFVGNKVTDNGSQASDKNKEFEYTVQLTKTAGVMADTDYTYKLYQADAAGTTWTDQNADGTMKTGTPTTIKLKHNQRIVFETLPAGTLLTVSQGAVSGYTTTVEAKTGGTLLTLANTDKVVTADNLIVAGDAAGQNYADFTNKLDDTSITGIVMSNIPYVGLIAVAIVGLGIGLFGKKRRNQEEID